MNRLIEQLRLDGIAKGLCQPWQVKLTQPLDTQGLVKLYVKGIDFCISGDYPTLDFLRENFKGVSEPYGVFIDDEVACRNMSDMVLNGACSGSVCYNGYSVSRMYARHTTELTIEVSDNAMLTIDAFDDAKLTINADGNKVRVYVNLYGNAQMQHTGSGVKVRKMNKKTY